MSEPTRYTPLADRYVLGKPGSRFAVTRRVRSCDIAAPWKWPKGGWRVGRFIVWWSA